MPIHYAVMRYGNDSSFTRILRQFCEWVGEPEYSPEELQLITEVATPHLAPKINEYRTTDEVANIDGENFQESSQWNGGWNVDQIDGPTLGDGRCDIVEVWTGLPSSQEFFETFLRKGIPVIFRNALQLQNNSLLHAFQKQEFLSTYGSYSIPISQIPYANTFGKKNQMTDFREVVLWLCILHLF